MEIKYNYICGNLVLKSNNLKKFINNNKKFKINSKNVLDLLNKSKILNKKEKKLDEPILLEKKKKKLKNKINIIKKEFQIRKNNNLKSKKTKNFEFKELRKNNSDKNFSFNKLIRKKLLLEVLFNKKNLSKSTYFNLNNKMYYNFNIKDKNFIQNSKNLILNKNQNKIIDEKKYKKFYQNTSFNIKKSKLMIKKFLK